MFTFEIPTIATDRLRLRAFKASDLDAYAAMRANPEIIYSLDRPYWGQGFATEAARAARDWLFEHFPLDRAASLIQPDHQASKRVVQKLGAVREGTYERGGVPHEWWVHYRARGTIEP